MAIKNEQLQAFVNEYGQYVGNPTSDEAVWAIISKLAMDPLIFAAKYELLGNSSLVENMIDMAEKISYPSQSKNT